jgi:muramoyltetrapeptide carboxypeptidase
MINRRKFIGTISGAAMGLAISPNLVLAQDQDIIKPPALKMGDTVGLITPASSLFEPHQTIIEATEKISNLGFKVKLGAHIYKKWGYLAGTDQERADDIHKMFADDDVRAIIAIRGGYGSGRVLKYLDYDLIKRKPKILLGYSDVTSLILGIHKMTGLVTFHGPVAVSTFTDFTKKYFYKILTETEAAGEIDDAPFSENLQTTNRVWTVVSGSATGPITGGNLTLIMATLGTPYEIDTDNRILFIEEVSEEPYDLDRYLTQLDAAGKFKKCRGVVFDRMSSVKPANYGAGFNSSLSKEEVIEDRFKNYNFPVCLGLSLGHVADKPTIPIGIKVKLDADNGRISILENAVS